MKPFPPAHDRSLFFGGAPAAPAMPPPPPPAPASPTQSARAAVLAATPQMGRPSTLLTKNMQPGPGGMNPSGSSILGAVFKQQ